MPAEITACVQEFYCIQALESFAKTDQFRHSHDRWRRDFYNYKHLFTSNLAQAMLDYSTLVCFGEMRHGEERCSCYNPHVPYVSSRDYSYEAAKQYSTPSILRAAKTLFGCKWLGDSYGGRAWWLIAEVALNRAERKTGWCVDEVFIDRCVDLSHNGSIYFDKNESNIFWLYDKHLYKRFLDFKKNASLNDIIAYKIDNESRSDSLSARLASLVKRAETLEIIPEVPEYGSHVWFGEHQLSIGFILNYTPIKWGEESLPDDIDESHYDEEDDDDEENWEEECEEEYAVR